MRQLELLLSLFSKYWILQVF